jgi:hypothetical protein
LATQLTIERVFEYCIERQFGFCHTLPVRSE